MARRTSRRRKRKSSRDVYRRMGLRCELCGKTHFLTSMGLRKHYQTAHRQKPKYGYIGEPRKRKRKPARRRKATRTARKGKRNYYEQWRTRPSRRRRSKSSRRSYRRR